MKKIVLLLVTFAALSACRLNNSSNEKYHLVFQEFDSITVGVLPDVGGRIIFAAVTGNQNIFKADTGLWNENPDLKPSMDAVFDYKPYHGHVVWPGPMSSWWKNQNFYEEKKESGSRWPPDPYLDYGIYTLETSHNELVMISPHSPITGIQFKKSIHSYSRNAVVFECEMKNIRDSTLTLNIWFNTRFPGNAQCYIPIADTNSFWVKETIAADRDPVPFGIQDNYFCFYPDSASISHKFATSKAYIYPSKPYMAAFYENQVMVIRFKQYDKNTIHPEHALVEVFNQRSTIGSEDLLELEVHSALREMKPGQGFSEKEIWHLLNYTGGKSVKEHIQYLKNNEHKFIN